MIEFIGNGGHRKVVEDVIDSMSIWKVLTQLCKRSAFVAIGVNKTRKRCVNNELLNYYKYFTPTHSSAVIGKDVTIGEGTVVMAGVVIQHGARIGKHCILNTACTVDHHCVIEDFVHIAPGVHLCGGVQVGEGALMGVGSCAVPMARIEAWSVVKAGSVAK